MSFDSQADARRRFLRRMAGFAAVGSLSQWQTPAHAIAQQPDAPRGLLMHHTHTGERIDLIYALGAQYRPAALGALNHFLRDHYSGEVGHIDPALFDLLHRLQLRLGVTAGSACYEVISGYRCPVTNARLKKTGGGGVATRSLHLQGQAIDLRLPGVALADVRDAALSLKAGGVGYYPGEQFVHLDTGRVRNW